MASSKSDLEFYRMGVQELKDYLLSDQLFWPLTGNLPRLTLGSLLLARERLRAWPLESALQADGARLSQRMEAVHERWRSAWERKAAWEYRSRLNQWRHFLEDYRREGKGNAAYYPQEVKLRVMLDLLEPHLPEDSDHSVLPELDKLLRRHFEQGDFVWEPELKDAFPNPPYWYLYGRLAG